MAWSHGAGGAATAPVLEASWRRIMRDGGARDLDGPLSTTAPRRATMNEPSGTRIHEIAAGIYRLSTPMPTIPGGFSFNQYLIVDDEPLLFHTGPRRMFPLVRQAIETLMPVSNLQHIAFSHFEADECGALNQLLEVAPRANPVCGRIAALVSVEDYADRKPTALADGARLTLGGHVVRWFDAPHVPHAWECGYLFEEKTRTLLCGDLFTQPGTGDVPLTETDILEPSESMRRTMDYYSHTKKAGPIIERLAAAAPATLACMHGSAWHGDGAALLRELARRLGP
jgi:flavorubredoxin